MAQTLSLDLDEQTLARARAAALAKGLTLEALVTDTVRQLVQEGEQDADMPASGLSDPMLGMFADATDLIDQVVADAMEARERDSLRPAS